MILDATDLSIEVILDKAKTTNDMDFVTSYADNTATTYVPAMNHGVTNGTTAVTLVAAPAVDTQREVRWISIYNADTRFALVTVRLNHNNADYRTLWKGLLLVGQELIYTPERGFSVLDGGKRVLSGQDIGCNDDVSNIEGANVQRLFGPGNSNTCQTSDISALGKGSTYLTYLGRVITSFVITYIEFAVNVIGVGVQTAGVGIFSTPVVAGAAFPVQLYCVAANNALDSLTTTGVKRNTASLAYTTVVGDYLYMGIRVSMVTTQPRVMRIAYQNVVGNNVANSHILRVDSAHATAGAIAVGKVYEGMLYQGAQPDMRVVID